MLLRKVVTRVALAAIAFTPLLLTGCATELQDAQLSARNHDPEGLVTGIPARGENVCLGAASGVSSDIDIAVRRSLTDRGYGTTFLSVGEQPSAKTCRFYVTISATALRVPGTVPRRLAIDYRDLYTGETQRAEWTRDGVEARSAFLRASPSSGCETFMPSAWGDVDRIVGNLVDRLFPETVRGR